MRSISPGGWRTAAFTVVASIAIGAACTQELRPRSTIELMEEPAVLQGVLHRCNLLQGAALRDPECRNAREAVERMASEEQTGATAAAEKEFEKARAARRARDEMERQQREAREKVDPYTLPLVTDPAPASPPTSAVMSTASVPNS